MAYLFSGSCLATSFSTSGSRFFQLGSLLLSSGWNTPAASWRSRKLADGTTSRNRCYPPLICLPALRWNQNVIHHFNPGLFFEIRYRVRRDIIRPVINMQGFCSAASEPAETAISAPVTRPVNHFYQRRSYLFSFSTPVNLRAQIYAFLRMQKSCIFFIA